MVRLLKVLGLPVVLGLSLMPLASMAELKVEGEAIQGGLLIGSVAPGSLVKVDGTLVRLSPDGKFLMGFSRDDTKPLQLVVTGADGVVEKRTLTPAVREYDIQRIDGLPPSKVTPRSEKTLKRIRKETAMVKNARKRDDARTDFLSGFIWPAKGRISGVYGSQRVLNGKPRRPHYGVDVAAPAGTPVVAPAGGIITMVHPNMFFSGGTILLDHGHGLTSAFLHLKTVDVKKGQRVEQGDKIGTIGSTGRSTGAHVDWRMNLFNKRLDVARLVPPQPAHE